MKGQEAGKEAIWDKSVKLPEGKESKKGATATPREIMNFHQESFVSKHFFASKEKKSYKFKITNES